MAASVLFLLLVSVVVPARFYVRIKIVRSFGSDDWATLVATVRSILRTTCLWYRDLTLIASLEFILLPCYSWTILWIRSAHWEGSTRRLYHWHDGEHPALFTFRNLFIDKSLDFMDYPTDLYRLYLHD